MHAGRNPDMHDLPPGWHIPVWADPIIRSDPCHAVRAVPTIGLCGTVLLLLQISSQFEFGDVDVQNNYCIK